jgi:hypothetical protein
MVERLKEGEYVGEFSAFTTEDRLPEVPDCSSTFKNVAKLCGTWAQFTPNKTISLMGVAL